jgi:hypothetical protein
MCQKSLECNVLNVTHLLLHIVFAAKASSVENIHFIGVAADEFEGRYILL